MVIALAVKVKVAIKGGPTILGLQKVTLLPALVSNRITEVADGEVHITVRVHVRMFVMFVQLTAPSMHWPNALPAPAHKPIIATLATILVI